MSLPAPSESAAPRRVLLFGEEASVLAPEVDQYDTVTRVDTDPEVVICYGGDGTLLAAEMQYPGLPKVPILNSLRGHRCIPHPADDVIAGLAEGKLVSNTYTKLSATVQHAHDSAATAKLTALNEFSIHMGRINSAVRFRLFLNDEPYQDGQEILGDGLVICTPFGSTAYFQQITRGVFTKGIGIAFKATTEHVNHLVLPSDVECRIEITRGPAVLAYDSAQEYHELNAQDTMTVRKHPEGATILTCGPVKRLDEPF